VKKYIILLLLFVAMIISACSEDTKNNGAENTSDENDQPENAMNESEPVEDEDESEGEEEGEGETSTEDVMEFAKNDQYDTFIRYLEEYKDIGTYVHDDSDDIGFNEIEFDGFHVNFVFKLLEDQGNGEQVIGFIAETENNSGDEVAFNADMEIQTSNGEQTEALQGLGTTEQGQSTSGLLLVPIEDGVPDSFVVKFERPFRDIVDGQQSGHLGEEIEMEFQKQ